MKNKIISAAVVIMLAAIMLCAGCAGKSDKKIVLSTGFAADEVFFIGTKKCTVPEINVYMRTSQDQYEAVFGSEIWDKDIDGTTLEDRLKETTLARIAQIKAMNLLAESRDISLDDDGQKKCREAAEKYMSGLSEKEKESLGVTEELVEKMYSEYALANKIYDSITQDVNPEISDDEARTITVKQILIKTYYTDVSGNMVQYSDAQKKSAYEKAKGIIEKINTGSAMLSFKQYFRQHF